LAYDNFFKDPTGLKNLKGNIPNLCFSEKEQNEKIKAEINSALFSGYFTHLADN
jgi:hypothetical protein